MTVTDDPIVEELHKIREEMLAEHGGLEGFVKHLRTVQAEMPERVVRLDHKSPIETKRKIQPLVRTARRVLGHHSLAEHWDDTHSVEFELDVQSSLYFPVDRILAEKLRAVATPTVSPSKHS